MDFTYHANVDHKCKKDILIGRIKNVEDKSWKKIRPRPTKTNYEGPYYICKGTYHNYSVGLHYKSKSACCIYSEESSIDCYYKCLWSY
jgi:hypothetical protein